MKSVKVFSKAVLMLVFVVFVVSQLPCDIYGGEVEGELMTIRVFGFTTFED